MGIGGSKAAHFTGNFPSFKRARKLSSKVAHAMISRSKSVDSRFAHIPDSGRFSVESYPLSFPRSASDIMTAYPRSESDKITAYPRSESENLAEPYPRSVSDKIMDPSPRSEAYYPRSDSDKLMEPYPRSESDRIIEAYSATDCSSPCTPRLLLEWQHRIGDDYFDEALEMEFFERDNEADNSEYEGSGGNPGNDGCNACTGAETTGSGREYAKGCSAAPVSVLAMRSEAVAEDRRVIVNRMLGSVPSYVVVQS
ncbi:hypothetical protein CLOM_g5019 [Closterium sp. NIES-68]|nr:hypothetical protein CLOM_g5019 [Closterium sp. NIES-68]GJP67802.1 hypothetical protein CLOP_g24572 [Closterium sp. NIES-67]